APGEIAEAAVASSVEIKAPVGRRVGETLVGQRLGGGDDAWDLLGDTRHDVGRPPAKDGHVALQARLLVLGERFPMHAIPARPLEERIVDVGLVLDIADANAARLDVSDEVVEGTAGEGVAEVTRLVGCVAADIKRYLRACSDSAGE